MPPEPLEDSFENAPVERRRRGKITQFLRRNFFTVELDDGQRVTAVMPSELLHVAANFRHGLRSMYVSVVVELRGAPRLARIVDATEDGLTI
jgi:hypothetical protein